MRTVSRNNPIATVIKNYLNKKSGKVTDSRNEIQRRFFGLDWKTRRRSWRPFLMQEPLTGIGLIQDSSTCGMPLLRIRYKNCGRPTMKRSVPGSSYGISRRNISRSTLTSSVKAGTITSSAVGWQKKVAL